MRKTPRDPKRGNVAARGNRSQAGTPASVERESPHAPDVSPKNKKKLAAACELDLIPEVGYICPSCKIFVKFHVKQKERLTCMQPHNVVTPRKALLF